MTIFVRSSWGRALVAVLGVFIFHPQLAKAKDTNINWDGQIGYSVLSFGYKEFNDTSEVLDREDGLIPGLYFGLSATISDWRLFAAFSYHGGTVDYQGFSQSIVSGVRSPLETDTREHIADSTLQIERQLRGIKSEAPVVYAGLGYHNWERNIQPGIDDNGVSVQALSELYEWWHVFLGMRSPIFKQGRSYWQLNFRLSQVFEPTMKVIFIPREYTFELGSHLGWRLSVPWHRPIDGVTSVFVEPYAERWRLGRSPNQAVDIAGTVREFFEPSSTTQNYGINIGLNQQF